ncbi:hypothetical protein CSB45_12925 [candidate division KSB3 bacterium]|uniref:Uncharacterized protein n=1 Tax=candidate division KSB3 bacterium TaxID=2044937 RepID=A0A2G6E2K4_9BACT|nr:MAG: hypothetical protein CSB45_12925 [candidate division KSB3 bacterium]PIE28755.1 MAG: hypothetical protein CSA57_12025 [candidate division KSB3 bacterium]
MDQVITFTTRKFDVSKEDENPINPIHGKSLLIWLKENLAGKFELSEPEPEDWGWYAYINWQGRSYLLGVRAREINHPDYEWVFQIDKQRSLKEKLLGKQKMTSNDECFNFVKSLFESEPEIKNVAVE